MTPTKKTTTATVKPAPVCNVDDCTRTPTVRGLCDAHWATHRGLAGPKEDPDA